MTAVFQTTAHMETRALRWNLAWALWEAACCSLHFCFSLILTLLLMLSLFKIKHLFIQLLCCISQQGKDGGPLV